MAFVQKVSAILLLAPILCSVPNLLPLSSWSVGVQTGCPLHHAPVPSQKSPTHKCCAVRQGPAFPPTYPPEVFSAQMTSAAVRLTVQPATSTSRIEVNVSVSPPELTPLRI